MKQSFCNSFLKWLQEDPKAPFIYHFNSKNELVIQSYEETASIVLQSIRYMKHSGVKPEEIALCVLEDSYSILHFFLACSFINVIPAPISPSFSNRYIGKMIDDLSANFIFTSPDQLSKLKVFDLLNIIYCEPGDVAEVENVEKIWLTKGHDWRVSYEELQSLIGNHSSENIFMIQPTSGSTGIPKHVIRAHDSFFRYAKYVIPELNKVQNISRNRFLFAPALTHAFGWHMMAVAIESGAEIALPKLIDVRVKLDQIRRLNPTVLPFVPRVARKVFNDLANEEGTNGKQRLSRDAKIVIIAGGKGENAVLKHFNNIDLKVMEIYGASETSIIAYSELGSWTDQWIGAPADDTKIKFSDDGEVLVHSPGLMKGYFNDTSEKELAFDSEGYYKTGDIGEILENGYLSINGRKKDVFNTPEGSNIFPERIESVIESIDWVDQVMLIGDRKPFISAIICIQADNQMENLVCIDDISELGWLHPEHNLDLYLRANHQINLINDQMEEIEKIKRIVLIKNRLSDDFYSKVNGGKVRKNRNAFLSKFKNEIIKIYSDDFLDFFSKNSKSVA